MQPVEPCAQLVERLPVDQLLDELTPVFGGALGLPVRHFLDQAVPAQQLLHFLERADGLLRLARLARGFGGGFPLGLVVFLLGHARQDPVAERLSQLSTGRMRFVRLRGLLSTSWLAGRAP